MYMNECGRVALQFQNSLNSRGVFFYQQHRVSAMRSQVASTRGSAAIPINIIYTFHSSVHYYYLQ